MPSSSRSSQKRRLPKGNAGVKSGPIKDRKAVQARFLKEFISRGVVTQAAAAVGMTGRTHYDWLKGDAKYRVAFYEAEEAAADVLEEEARRRAVEGDEEPVGFYKGEASEYVVRRSDTLLKFLLEGRRASVFKHRHEVTGAGGGPLTITQIERVIVDPADEEILR